MQSPGEEQDSSICAQCGEPFWPELERGFLFGDEQVLCFACAVARGGIYDELKDRWLSAPDLSGLAIEDEHIRWV